MPTAEPTILQRLNILEEKQQQLQAENQSLREEVSTLQRWRRITDQRICTQFEIRLAPDAEPDPDPPEEEQADQTSPRIRVSTSTPTLGQAPPKRPKTEANSDDAHESPGEIILASEREPEDEDDELDISDTKTYEQLRGDTQPTPTAAVGDPDPGPSPAMIQPGLQSAAEPEASTPPDYKTNEDAPCCVCNVPWVEPENDIVFCDGCNLCVHQACYGVKEIPEGSWYCKSCQPGLKESPPCVFCPNRGGAMVPLDANEGAQGASTLWAHVICTLWIPGVAFNNPDTYDKVIKLNAIDEWRWDLKCSLCNLRGRGNGAVIQCKWKKCPTAFHVTCAAKYKLRMDWSENNLLPSWTHGVALEAYCEDHRYSTQEKQTAWETLIDYGSWDPGVEFKVNKKAVYGFLLFFKSKKSYTKTYAKAFEKYKALSQDDIKLSITSLRDSLLRAKHEDLKAKLTLILTNWPQAKKYAKTSRKTSQNLCPYGYRDCESHCSLVPAKLHKIVISHAADIFNL